MEHLVVEMDMPAPADAVWRKLTDWAGQSEWILLTTVRPVGPQRRGAGDRIEAFTGIGPVGFLDRMVVTRWEDGRFVTVDHVGRVVRGSGEFRVDPVTGTTSRLIWREDLDVPGGRLGSAAWRLIEPVNRWAVAFSLRRMAGGLAPADSQWPGQKDSSSSATVSGARSGIQ